MIATILGTIGTALLIGCAIPLALDAVRLGHARGVSKWFLGSWLLGELVMIAHVLTLSTLSWPLLANYVVSALLTGLVCYYRAFPRTRTLEQMMAEWERGD